MLQPHQKVAVAEITREKYSVINSLAGSLNEAQESSVIADIALWVDLRDSHVRLTGAVDFDESRDRSAIFHRVRNVMGLPFIPYSVDTPIMELLELEVGSNF